MLVFTVCSVVHGANCRELSPLPLDANTPVIGCVIASQVEGAKRIMGHPNYYEGDLRARWTVRKIVTMLVHRWQRFLASPAERSAFAPAYL